MIYVAFIIVAVIIICLFASIEFQSKLRLDKFYNQPFSVLKKTSFLTGYDLILMLIMILIIIIQIKYDLLFVTQANFNLMDILNMAFVVLGLYGVYISFLQFIVSFSSDTQSRYLGRSRAVIIIEQNPYIQITRKIVFSAILSFQILLPLIIYFCFKLIPKQIKENEMIFTILSSTWQTSLVVLSIIFILLIIKNIDIPIKALLINEQIEESESFNRLIIRSLINEFNNKFSRVSENKKLSIVEKEKEIFIYINNLISTVEPHERDIVITEVLYNKELYKYLNSNLESAKLYYQVNINKFSKTYINKLSHQEKNNFLIQELELFNHFQLKILDNYHDDYLTVFSTFYFDSLQNINFNLIDLQNDQLIHNVIKEISEHKRLGILVSKLKLLINQCINYDNNPSDYFSAIISEPYVKNLNKEDTLLLFEDIFLEVVSLNKYLYSNGKILSLKDNQYDYNHILVDLFTHNYFHTMNTLFQKNETEFNYDTYDEYSNDLTLMYTWLFYYRSLQIECNFSTSHSVFYETFSSSMESHSFPIEEYYDSDNEMGSFPIYNIDFINKQFIDILNEIQNYSIYTWPSEPEMYAVHILNSDIEYFPIIDESIINAFKNILNYVNQAIENNDYLDYISLIKQAYPLDVSLNPYITFINIYLEKTDNYKKINFDELKVFDYLIEYNFLNRFIREIKFNFSLKYLNSNELMNHYQSLALKILQYMQEKKDNTPFQIEQLYEVGFDLSKRIYSEYDNWDILYVNKLTDKSYHHLYKHPSNRILLAKAILKRIHNNFELTDLDDYIENYVEKDNNKEFIYKKINTFINEYNNKQDSL